jgi:hypothetical protein
MNLTFNEHIQAQNLHTILPDELLTPLKASKNLLITSMKGAMSLFQMCIIAKLDSKYVFIVATPKFKIPAYLQFSAQ